MGQLDSYRQERCILKSTSLIYSETEYRKCDALQMMVPQISQSALARPRGFTLKAISLPKGTFKVKNMEKPFSL